MNTPHRPAGLPDGVRTADEILTEKMEEPRARAAWARRSTRLRLVALVLGTALLGTAAFAVMVAARSGALVIGSALVLVIVLVFHAPLAQRLNAGARVLRGYERVVDERQRAETDHARALGHTVTEWMMTALAALGGIAHLVTRDVLGVVAEVPIGLASVAVWTVLALHNLFPACYLAWTRPDEEE
ncbi:hypothetical protein SUDANB121_03438 [Nocardiopsis dassonvillei]|uniref:hypothetical protein n=1 Tax=Nocardiopsis dassonvillei TaxID=2014 RepID=UPI003F562812